MADVFGECYSNSEDRAYALLVRRTKCWSKSTVLNLATEADAKSFFAHDGVQVAHMATKDMYSFRDTSFGAFKVAASDWESLVAPALPPLIQVKILLGLAVLLVTFFQGFCTPLGSLMQSRMDF